MEGDKDGQNGVSLDEVHPAVEKTIPTHFPEGPPSPTSPSSPNTRLVRRHQTKEVGDGCLILGNKEAQPYVTRYHIVKEKQREIIKEDMVKDMFPFIYHSADKNCCKRVWEFVKSEPFLLCLHITALVFSVLKRTIRDVEIDATLELVHGCLETTVAVMSILIRLLAGYQQFHSEKTARKKVEECKDSGRTHTLKTMMRVFYFVGIVLILLLVGALITLALLDKMHWTIVTTNFSLIVAGIGGNLVMQRLEGMVSRIHEDQHKAVIYESLLLLKETLENPDKPGLKEEIQHFCKAVESTQIFENEGHIQCADSPSKYSWNTASLVALQTSV